MLNTERVSFVWLGALSLLLVVALQAPAAWGQVVADDVVCPGCVQGSDIANGTIGPTKLIPGSINATTIANQSIGPNKLIPGSINATTIATDAIRGNKVLNGSLTGADLADGSLLAIDLSDEAGVDFVGGDSVVVLPSSGDDTIIRTVTLTAPTSGFAVAMATGQLFRTTAAAGTSVARCGLSQGTTNGNDVIAVDLNGDIRRQSVDKIQSFVVNSGSNVFNFICDQDANNNLTVSDTSLTVIFLPTRY